LVRPLVFLALVGAPWLSPSSPSGAAVGASAPDRRDPALPADAPHAGLHYGGLRRADPAGPCAGAFEITLGRGLRCTHGPDPAPSGVDAAVRPTIDTLRIRARDHRHARTADATAAAPASTGVVYCYGDGTTGDRVEAIYAHAADVSDRYAGVLTSLQQFAATVDGVFNESAAETGGVRHVRFVTDSECNLVVHDETLSSTGDDSFDNTESELIAKGYSRPDRLYLVWVDAAVYCGIADFYRDDRNISSNVNTAGPRMSRLDAGCWDGYSEAHELMHNLGGVQASAPHATGWAHCYDDADRMCYNDGSPYFANGGTMQKVCPDPHEFLFDCGHDDYFSTDPAAGTYLATHWNPADSPFLETVDGIPPPHPPPPPPPPMRTSTFSGTSAAGLTATYYLDTGEGPFSATATWDDRPLAPELTMTIRSASGEVLARATGRGPLTVSAGVTAGRTTVTVSSPTVTSFQLSVTYPRP
jgi:hypothetical protein